MLKCLVFPWKIGLLEIAMAAWLSTSISVTCFCSRFRSMIILFNQRAWLTAAAAANSASVFYTADSYTASFFSPHLYGILQNGVLLCCILQVKNASLFSSHLHYTARCNPHPTANAVLTILQMEAWGFTSLYCKLQSPPYCKCSLHSLLHLVLAFGKTVYCKSPFSIGPSPLLKIWPFSFLLRLWPFSFFLRLC